MFGRRHSLGASPPPDSNGNDASYHPLPFYESKAGVNDGLTRSRSSASTWHRTAASGDSGGLEPLPRQTTGLRKSLSTRPLTRKLGPKLQPPLAAPDGDGYSKLDDHHPLSSTSSAPRGDLRAHLSRAATLPERAVSMSSHGSVSSGVTPRVSPSRLDYAAATATPDELLDDEEPVKHPRFSRLNTSSYQSPPAATRARVMSSHSMYAPPKPLAYTSSLSPSSRRNRSSTLHEEQNSNPQHHQQSQTQKQLQQLQQPQQPQQPQQQSQRLRSALSPLPGRASLVSPTTTNAPNVRSSPKQRSGVWDELENVKERLNRLKVSSPSSGRRSSLDNSTSTTFAGSHYTNPTASHAGPHGGSTSFSGAGLSHTSLGHHPHSIEPPQSASNLFSVTRATPPATTTQAARHLRDVLARVRQQPDQDVNLLLLERAARDILALYDDPCGPDPRGIDQACLSLGSYIMQTLDSAAQTAAAAAAATTTVTTPTISNASVVPPLPTQAPVAASPVLARDPGLDSPRRLSVGVRRHGATGPNSNKRHSLTFM
ncbi:hypothetical protein DV495_000902 [Geotrichum candidum]|nr:hypothetical protein DV452_000890 [Geotrichum candidum]KAF5135272.1 hypothetical protein DV495_000902 [Geotrichum candidum]KAF7501196.1 hypothetical protein DV113_000768 [Geotrichum candidum]KAI8136120.1 hypothetical protein DUD61_000276 [Geotrichum candidum]KAI9214907.1 hypothetical protein DS838_000238 [Geotrichum bryndzae]